MGFPLRAWGQEGAACAPIAGGLINRTFRVEGSGGPAVLQWVNPIFAPQVHLDIEAVTRRLAAAGLPTPLLIPARDGALWVDDPAGGCWRMMALVPGLTHHRVGSPALAAAAGRLVARFHRAMEGFDYAYRHVRPGFHDTPFHMRALADGLPAAPAEPAALARQILAAWEGCAPAEGDLIHGHGDLKISNLLFDAAGEGVCLVDLDTLGRMPLAVELGDALRSWCNPAGEEAEAAISVELFHAALQGYGEIRPLSPAQRAQIVRGVEQISLELAARFCRDAWEDRYFGWDSARFPSRVAHNLHRARGQFLLACSVRRETDRLLAG